MRETKNKIYVTWNDVVGEVKGVVSFINSFRHGDERIDVVCPRYGAWPIGAVMANLLRADIEEDRVRIHSYPEVLKESRSLSITVLVDDVYDTGRTLGEIEVRLRKHLHIASPCLACLYVKVRRGSTPKCRVLGRRVPDKWIVFPWE